MELFLNENVGNIKCFIFDCQSVICGQDTDYKFPKEADRKICCGFTRIRTIGIANNKQGLIDISYFTIDEELNLKEDMHLFVVKEVKGTLIDCDEGTLKYIPKNKILNLELWEGDKIFLKYLLTDKPYFELELNYLKDKLVSYRFIK